MSEFTNALARFKAQALMVEVWAGVMSLPSESTAGETRPQAFRRQAGALARIAIAATRARKAFEHLAREEEEDGQA